MTKVKSRDLAKKESREALVNAALELFPKQGIDVSLDELCSHAGYTRGVFYVHFKNRDELLLEVMTRIGQQWLDSVFGDSDNDDDLITLIQRFLHELVEGDYPIKQGGGIRPHQLLDACARSVEIKQKYIELIGDSIRRLTHNVKNSQQKQQIKADVEPEQIATILLALAIGAHTAYDLEYPMDFAKTSTALAQLLMS